MLVCSSARSCAVLVCCARVLCAPLSLAHQRLFSRPYFQEISIKDWIFALLVCWASWEIPVIKCLLVGCIPGLIRPRWIVDPAHQNWLAQAPSGRHASAGRDMHLNVRLRRSCGGRTGCMQERGPGSRGGHSHACSCTQPRGGWQRPMRGAYAH